MGLREYLEEQIAEDLKLRKEYEDKLRTEIDPRLKLKWREDIKEVKQRILEREEELRSLSASPVQPEPVTPYPSPPATPPPKPKQEVKLPTQPPPSQPTASPLAEPEPEEVEEPITKPDEVKLRSERGVDYTKLRNLLAAGEWKEADQETAKVMCQAVVLESERELRVEDIDNCPCEDLRTINQLWLHYSKGKFGFSVQKEIYDSQKGQIDGDWSKFCERVGWRKRRTWLSYSDLTFNVEKAPKAHLPAIAHERRTHDAYASAYRTSSIFHHVSERAKTCNL